jgi:hypothetical protein
MKASPRAWIDDANYATNLLAEIEFKLSISDAKVLAEIIGLPMKSIMKIRKSRYQLKFPEQVLLESHLPSERVKALRAYYLSKTRPTWEKRYARH